MRPGGGKRNTALALTFCGVLAALGAAIMIGGGMLAVATYCAPLMASLCIIPMLTEFGRGRALMGYAVTAVLAILLSPDKESAFFYLFLGWYPIVRALFFRIEARTIRVTAKLLCFAAMTAALYLFLCFVLRLDAVTEELSSAGALMNAAFFAALVISMLVFDVVLDRAERIYILRLRPKLRFLS